MLLSNQVCTLDQAKRLKELGLHAPSALGWHINVFDKTVTKIVIVACLYVDWEFAAYSVAELGVMLSCAEGIEVLPEYEPKNIVEMYSAAWLGKVVIYLLENNLITAQQVNDRLKG